MTAAKKTTPAPLSLPERPPSKVEAGLKGEAKATDAVVSEADAKAETPEAKRERAIEAMVDAGLSREYAEASFVLAEQGNGAAEAAEVADAVAELREAEDHGAPLCKHCFPASWKDIPAERDAVGCTHGTYPRKP